MADDVTSRVRRFRAELKEERKNSLNLGRWNYRAAYALTILAVSLQRGRRHPGAGVGYRSADCGTAGAGPGDRGYGVEPVQMAGQGELALPQAC